MAHFVINIVRRQNRFGDLGAKQLPETRSQPMNGRFDGGLAHLEFGGSIRQG